MQKKYWQVDEYWSVSKQQPDSFERHASIQQAVEHAGDKGFVCTSPIGQFFQVIEEDNGKHRTFDLIAERTRCDLSNDRVYQAARNLQRHYMTLRNCAVFHA